MENSPSEGLLTKDSTFPSKEINNEWAITMPFFKCYELKMTLINMRGYEVALWFVRCTVLIERSGFEGWGHCIVFLGKTLYSHSASLHPGV